MLNASMNITPCPVCGTAMTRLAHDESLIVYRCYTCATEIVKPPPRTRARRRIVSPERRMSACRGSGFFDCRDIAPAQPCACEPDV